MEGGLIFLGFVLLMLGGRWFDNLDDTRLDDLRETAVEACADRTESVEQLGDCVTATIKATGQKP